MYRGKVNFVSKTFATCRKPHFNTLDFCQEGIHSLPTCKIKYISNCEGWWEDTYFEESSLSCLRPYIGVKRPWFSLCKYLFNFCVNSLNKVSSWVALKGQWKWMSCSFVITFSCCSSTDQIEWCKQVTETAWQTLFTWPSACIIQGFIDMVLLKCLLGMY